MAFSNLVHQCLRARRVAVIRSSVRTSLARTTASSGNSVLAVCGGEPDITSRSSEQPAAKPLASVQRPGELDLGLRAAKAIVVFGANQRPIDAGRADL